MRAKTFFGFKIRKTFFTQVKLLIIKIILNKIEGKISMLALQRINEIIVENIRRHWNERESPILVAQLGSILNKQDVLNNIPNNIGLKRYIKENLSDSIRFIPMLKHDGAFAPKEETESLSDQEIEQKYTSHKYNENSIKDFIPNYWGHVWKAFQTPLDDGMVRYLLLEAHGKPEVLTVNNQTKLPDNAKIIEKSDIICDQNKKYVHMSIENWCVRNSVPVNSLYFKRAKFNNEIQQKIKYSMEKNINYFSIGFSKLTIEELKRINIPADLVFNILERFLKND